MKKILFALIFIPFMVFTQNSWVNDFRSDLSFIENKGQFDGRNWDTNSDIKYAIDANTFYVFFTPKGFTYRFDKIIKNPKRDKTDPLSPKRTNISELIKINWIGANQNVEIVAEDANSDYYSYAIKDLETKEVVNENNILGYKKIIYKNLYDNIDVEYSFHKDGGIKYSFILHPGADASQIKMKYSSASTDVADENIVYGINNSGEIYISTSLGRIVEHKPSTFYKNTNEEINSSFSFANNILTFNLENHDNTKEIVIDPWVQSPNFTTSTAVWEVETDNAGNVYVTGGETPMELKKYNSAGAIQWTYTTPWDTASVWLGTLATDAGGTSYITSGTTPEMERVDATGGMIWHQGAGAFASDEYWSITFNCDKTKLIVGGTHFVSVLGFDVYAAIFDIDPVNGNVLSRIDLAYTDISVFGQMPVEVRSISSSADAKYVFLTHEEVGAINQNIGACPNDVPVFQVPNDEWLGYKCENYLPETQNGGGLKALIANDNFFYTNTGDKVRKWNLSDGALLATVSLPGGNLTPAASFPIAYGAIVHNSGLDVDDAGNVYAGSGDRVVKFDQDLNILQESTVSFTVYDVSVNNNGEVIACGAQSDNGSVNRNGRIEAVNMSAGAQFALICCDVNICPPDTVCDSDPAFDLTVSSPGGTFTGTGITNATNGTFDPSVAGVGTHTITYTKPCGSETVEVMVSACLPIDVCDDGTNYVATGGIGSITWYDWETTTTNISTEAECTSCGGTWLGIACTISSCTSTDWVQIGTGTTLDPSLINSWPIMVTDGTTQLTFNSASEIAPCSPCTNPTLAETHIDLTCAGDNSGSIDLTITPGSGTTYNTQWSGPNGFSSTQEDITSLEAGTYTVTVTDASNASCDATLTITVNDGAATDDASFTLTDFCENATNSANITGTVGGSFTFNPAATNGETINASTGAITGGIGGNTYTIEYTTNGTCPASSTETVTVNANPSPTISGSLTFCTGLTTTLDAGSYAGWNWNPNGETTQTITVGTAGTYTVIVTDVNGCTGTTQVDVIEASSLSPIITGVLSICSGASTTLDAGAGYTGYTWAPNSETSQTITVNTAGTYSVTVVDAGGCTGTTQVDVVANTNPTPSITGSLSFCTGGSTTLDAGAGYTDYAWTPAATTQTISATTAGNYAVTVTDGNGCIGTDNVDVTIAAGLSPSITGVLTICSGNSTTLDAGVGYADYIWAPNNETSQTINVTTSGTYTVTVSDASGCSGTDQVTVTVDNNPIPNITGTLAICSGASTTLDAGTGFASYLWSPNGETTQTINVTTGGNYSVQVSNASGCNGTDQVTVTENQNPTPSITGNLTICQGSSTILDAGTGYANYIWTPNNETSQTINVSTAGTYTVSVTTNAGCSGTSSVDVTVVAGLSVSITGNLNICGGTTTTLDAGAGYPNYIWSTNDATQTITTGNAGTYSVTVSDNNGCSATDAVTIDVSNLTLVTSGDDEICKGASTTISAALSGGGTAPFTYTWDNGETTSDITVSPASETTYTVYVTDAMGCVSNTEIVVISVVPGVELSITANKDTVCPGDPVLITSLVTGGKPPYTITDGAGNVVSVNDIIYPYQSQTYTYTVTDACSSIDIDMVDIGTYNVPPLNIQADILQGCEPLAVNLIVPDYTEGYTYQWSFINGSINDIATGANILHIFEHFGTYNVGVSVVTDDGCKNSLLINNLIDVYRKPKAHFITTPQTVSIINPQINFNNLSQWADYYIWSFGDGDSSNISSPYHTYSNIDTYNVMLIAQTNKGCLDSAKQTIVVVEEPTIYVPTAFSPDGDGINDLFVVQANGMDLDNYEIKIYDRWGEMIFESNDLYRSWDGTAKEKTEYVENGSYVWLVTVKDVNGIELQKSGTVTVIR